jgi:hypothetical protein
MTTLIAVSRFIRTEANDETKKKEITPTTIQPQERKEEP